MAGAALVAALTLGAGLAAAEGAGGARQTDEESRNRFRACRAAIFYHVEPKAEQRTVPRAFAEALLEQFDFIMFETIRAARQDSVAAERKALSFVEEFFLNFGEALGDHAAEYRDVVKREKALIACQPFVWRLARLRVDHLMQWRERAIGAPPPPPEFFDELRAMGLRQAP